MSSKRRLCRFFWPPFVVDQLLRFGQVAVLLRALLAYCIGGVLLFFPALLAALYLYPDLDRHVDTFAQMWAIAVALTMLLGGIVAVVSPSRDVLTRRSDG